MGGMRWRLLFREVLSSPGTVFFRGPRQARLHPWRGAVLIGRQAQPLEAWRCAGRMAMSVPRVQLAAFGAARRAANSVAARQGASRMEVRLPDWSRSEGGEKK